MTNTKLIFSDVDNTLIKSSIGWTPLLKQAIKKCSENGIEFVLCSGRPTFNLINVATMLINEGIDLNYVAGYNGCEIYDLKKKTYIHKDSITNPSEIAATLDSHKIDYLMYNEDTIYSTNLMNEYSVHEAVITELRVSEMQPLDKTPKVLALVNPSDMNNTLSKVKKELTDFTVVSSTPFFIEITNKGTDKGSGLKKMQEYLNLDMSEVICFGDAGNDLGMFEVCPNGVAVANATDEIKRLARKTIESVEDDGVAKYILKHLS